MGNMPWSAEVAPTGTHRLLAASVGGSILIAFPLT